MKMVNFKPGDFKWTVMLIYNWHKYTWREKNSNAPIRMIAGVTPIGNSWHSFSPSMPVSFADKPLCSFLFYKFLFCVISF